ncbi:MAG TPA: sugar ABC transporter permease, partial [Desertimonas sp.]|nr:sugar ABC transporter permease [Desertimonas sp.]
MTKPPRRRSAERWRDLPAAILLLAPSFVVLAAFIVYPLGRAVWLGRQRCDSQGNNCRTTGWDQYLDVVRSDEFREAVVVTSKFALITVPIGLALGVGLAALADKYVRGVGAFRTIFSSTVATSVAVASLMWYFLLQPSVGVLSNLDWLQDLFPVIKRPGLLRDEGTALPAVAASSIWASLGFTFILVTAGLQTIPRDL